MLDTISPIGGWALDHVVELDRHAPGFAGRLFRASDERRQVVAAYLAAMQTGRLASALDADTASFLGGSDHRAILHRAFDVVPAGFRGALRRAGAQPHEPRFYTLLHQVLSRPIHTTVARVTRQLSSLDLTKLRIAHALPSSICTGTIVSLIDSVKEASDVARGFDLLIEHGADEAALADAIRGVSSSSELGSLWKRWVGKTAFAEHPVPASAVYTPITNAADLKRLGRRYANCAEHHIVNCLAGEYAFAEYRRDDRGLVVHLRQKAGGWIVADLLGKNNKRPNGDLKEEALTYLAGYGVGPQPKPKPERDRLAVLNRLCSYRYFGFDEDD